MTKEYIIRLLNSRDSGDYTLVLKLIKKVKGKGKVAEEAEAKKREILPDHVLFDLLNYYSGDFQRSYICQQIVKALKRRQSKKDADEGPRP